MYLDRWHFQDTTNLCWVGPIINCEHAAELWKIFTWQRNKVVKFTESFIQGRLLHEILYQPSSPIQPEAKVLCYYYAKWIWKPTSALTRDQHPAPCPSLFCHLFLLLQLYVGGSFTLGDVPSRYNLMQSFVLQWLPGCLLSAVGMPI